MADEAKRSGGGLQRLVLWFVIAALLGTVWVLASERNERHFRVATHVVTDNKSHQYELIIERGRFFPMGTAPSGDKVYAPVPIAAGEKPPPEMEFDDQNALDRYLFGVLSEWAKQTAKKGDTHEAKEFVDRANQLPGLAGAQIAELMAMKADLAWDDASSSVLQAAALLDVAVQNLQAVTAGKGPRAQAAQQEAERLHGIAQELANKGVKAPAAPAAAASPPAPPAK